MGSLGGHLIPGGFFIAFATWWSFITAIRFHQTRLRSPINKLRTVGYKSTATMPCICLPTRSLRRAPIESLLKLVFGTIGMLIEVVFGFETLIILANGESVLASDFNQGHVSAQMNPSQHGGAQHHKRNVMLPMNSSMASPLSTTTTEAVNVTTWTFTKNSLQHVTMYASFMLGSLVEIAMHYRADLPAKSDYAVGIVAFGVEAFLFAFHLHGRTQLDIQVHTFLVMAIMGCMLFVALEVYDPSVVLFTYGRIACTLLQGSWFCQTGFVLYTPAWLTRLGWFDWRMPEHDLLMVITASFCWHVLIIVVALWLQLWLVKRLCGVNSARRKCWDEHLDDLMMIDVDTRTATSATYDQLSCVANEDESQLLDDKYGPTGVAYHDDNSLDEHVTLDTTQPGLAFNPTWPKNKESLR